MPAPYWPQTALLHDHMDGSRPLLSILPYLTKLSGQKYRFNPWARHHEQIQNWFKDPQINIVEKFSVTTGVMKTPETIRLAAKTYVQVRARQGFKYCEATIAPQYHLPPELDKEIWENGMLDKRGRLKPKIAKALKKAVEAFIEGIKEGEKEFPDIEVNLLLTIGREVSPLEAVRLLEVYAECDRSYAVGTGLVCDEGAHPPEKHVPMFRRAKELGIKTDCHAGEWCHLPLPFDENTKVVNVAAWERYQRALLANVYVAVFQLETDRLSHAIPLAYDYNVYRGEVQKAVLKRNIPVLGCPGSNKSSKLIPNMRYLGIRDLLQIGMLYSMHPDDDLFQPDMNEVFQECNDEYRFTEEEKQLLLLNPWLSRFGSRKEHKLPA